MYIKNEWDQGRLLVLQVLIYTISDSREKYQEELS